MMHEAGSYGEHERLPIDIDTGIRDAVARSELAPGGPVEVLSVTDISTFDHLNNYLVETPDNDLIVYTRTVKPNETTSGTDWQRTGDPCFQLGGSLEQKHRTMLVAAGDGSNGVAAYHMNALPSPNSYNRIMRQYGRHPGVDTFKMVAVDAAELSAQATVEAAAHLEVLAARADPEFVEHDRNPEGHLHSWWSTPDSILQRIRYNATEALGGDQGGIEEFSGGLDRLQNLTRQLIQPLFELLNNQWSSSEEIVAQAQGIVQNLSSYNPELFYDSGSDSVNVFSSVCVPLVELGLITRTPTVKVREVRFIETIDWPKDDRGEIDPSSLEMRRAEREVLPIVAAYARNITDLLARSSGQENSELARALQVGLEPELVAGWPKHTRIRQENIVDDINGGGTPLEWDD